MPDHSPDLRKALVRLDSLVDRERAARATTRVDLSAVSDLRARMGFPERQFKTVHVTGTKGKGSVCALIKAGRCHAGLSVGPYASPHVERINERITHNRRDIKDDALADALSHALDARDAARLEKTSGAHSTWFDVFTVAAFRSCAVAGLEWVVVEVGLGGRLDSTNVIESAVSVITNIGLEHTAS